MGSRYKSRDILKSYFRKGNVPTADQFAQLIDSVPNIEDDGNVVATAADGIRLFPTGTSRTVATVFAEIPGHEGACPQWRMALGADGSLELCDSVGEPVMTIDKEKNVTVSGTFKAACCRSDDGGEPIDTLKIGADGLWHDLPVESAVGQTTDGCRVYSVSACYVDLPNGKYSACEVLASHCRGRQRRVQALCRHWWGWSGHIKVRWFNRHGRLYLRIKGKGVRNGSGIILCRLETVWKLSE